jgi:membrane-associated protein
MTAVPMLLGINWMDPNWLLAQFGSQFFWISLLIVFIECGLLFPFLPGDTLLFAIGLFVATGKIDVFGSSEGVELVGALLLMVVAAFAGNVVGYEIGRKIGEPLKHHDGRLIRAKHLTKTAEFFDHHGSMALVLGRFVPFVRTYITLVAGITHLDRRRFWLWSLVGAVLWVSAVLLAGFFLGAAFPSLGQNIDKAMIVILAFSTVPIGIEWWRHRHQHGDDETGTTDAGQPDDAPSSIDADRA